MFLLLEKTAFLVGRHSFDVNHDHRIRVTAAQDSPL
jgi:hypothetical protein